MTDKAEPFGLEDIHQVDRALDKACEKLTQLGYPYLRPSYEITRHLLEAQRAKTLRDCVSLLMEWSILATEAESDVAQALIEIIEDRMRELGIEPEVKG